MKEASIINNKRNTLQILAPRSSAKTICFPGGPVFVILKFVEKLLLRFNTELGLRCLPAAPSFS